MNGQQAAMLDILTTASSREGSCILYTGNLDERGRINFRLVKLTPQLALCLATGKEISTTHEPYAMCKHTNCIASAHIGYRKRTTVWGGTV